MNSKFSDEDSDEEKRKRAFLSLAQVLHGIWEEGRDAHTQGFARPAFKVSQTLKSRGSERLYLIGVDSLKSLIFERLKRGQAIKFSNTLEATYFEQLASERLVTKFSRGRPVKMFEVIPGRRNETLDTLVGNHGVPGRAWRSTSPCARRRCDWSHKARNRRGSQGRGGWRDFEETDRLRA
jgi:hypothetical protein